MRVLEPGQDLLLQQLELVLDPIADDGRDLIQARAGRPAILRDPLCDREKLRAAVLAEAERQGLEVNVGLIDRGVSVEVVVKQ